MIISIYSKRLYKNELANEDKVHQLLVDCNHAKIVCYSRLAHEKLTAKQLNTTYIIDNFGLNTYYANMVERKAKQCLSSNVKLQKEYEKNIAEQIKVQMSKIKSLQEKLDFWEKIKIECQQQIKSPSNKSVFPCTFYENSMVKCFGKIQKTNKFEYEYVNNRINQLYSNIHNAKNKLNSLHMKLKNMKEQYPISCFGTKNFFKKQYTMDEYVENHKKWKEEFDYKRHNRFTISGCKNHIGGSMCVRYNPTAQTLDIMSHKQGSLKEGGKNHTQTSFTIPCEFSTYHYDEFIETLNNQEDIAYEIIDKGDYYIIQATFDYQYEEKRRVNDYIGNGINAIDINVDCFALTELDVKGNLLRRKVIHFNLEGKSSNQSTKILEEKVHEVLKFCKESKKPLVREHLTKITFKPTGDSNTNKILTQFAYDKMIEIIDRTFEKNSIKVFTVDPKYTSQQGKIKYMRRYGMSIHESAAMCIGRRFLLSTYDENGKVKKLYYENLLDYKRFGKIATVATQFKRIKRDNIYKIEKTPFDINKYKSLKTYIDDVNHYFYNHGEILKRSEKRLKDEFMQKQKTAS